VESLNLPDLRRLILRTEGIEGIKGMKFSILKNDDFEMS
jgi:hypothetical protein